MTSDSGSLMAGRSPMKCGLRIVDRPDRARDGELMKNVLITGCSSERFLEDYSILTFFEKVMNHVQGVDDDNVLAKESHVKHWTCKDSCEDG